MYDLQKIKHINGSVYDCLAPSANPVKGPGEWNHMTIACRDNMIYSAVNGEATIRMNMDEWPTAHENKDGSKNKFNIAYKDMARTGHIGFQDHGKPVWYRNIKIREF